MKFTLEDFQENVNKCQSAEEIDALCISWLNLLCTDNGKDGDRAKALLRVVGDLIGCDQI